MPKRGVLSSSFEGLASLEAKRQRQSEERQNRYLAPFDVTLELARSALFGFEAVIFPSFRPGFDVFTGQGIQRAKNLELGKIWVDAPKNQDRYHDDDLISLLSVNAGNVYSREPLYNLKGLRLSSQFFLKVIEAHISDALSENFVCGIRDSEVDEQNRGTNAFVEAAHQFYNSAGFLDKGCGEMFCGILRCSQIQCPPHFY